MYQQEDEAEDSCINIEPPPFRPSAGFHVCVDHKELPNHRSLVIEEYGELSCNVKLKIKEPEEVIPIQLGPT